MNANELADYWMKYPVVENAEATATMLRQQQEKLNKYELRNIAQCDRIAILEAQLKKAQSNCNGFCGEYECKENQNICKRKAQEKC